MTNKIKNILFASVILVLISLPMRAQNIWGTTNASGSNKGGTIVKLNDRGEYIKNIQFPVAGSGGIMFSNLLETDTGIFYGLTSQNNTDPYGGDIFEYNLKTNTFSTIYTFKTLEGKSSYSNLIKASNNKLYGLTFGGGTTNDGVIFEIDVKQKKYTQLASFSSASTGRNPKGDLVETTNGSLFGTTTAGGSNDLGTIFEFNINTGVLTKKYDFTGSTNGSYPFGKLLKASNNLLYGCTGTGGAYNVGTLFEYNPNTNSLTTLQHFNNSTIGGSSRQLIQANNGKFYGMCSRGGTKSKGTFYEYNLSNNTITKLLDMDGVIGEEGYALMQANDGFLYGTTARGGAKSYGVLFKYNISTATYTDLIDFNDTLGYLPFGGVIQSKNGKLYGTTWQGGAYNLGTIYELNTVTNQRTIKFNIGYAAYGQRPVGGLVQLSKTQLLGVCSQGGKFNRGTLFELNLKTEKIKVLHDFELTTGSNPFTSIMKASNGKIYGSTYNGGAYNNGVCFEYDTTTKTYRVVNDYQSIRTVYKLIELPNGVLAGCSNDGGDSSSGTLFYLDPKTNQLDIKVHFNSAIGNGPSAELLSAKNGKLYGSTSYGGGYDLGTLFEFDPTSNTIKKLLDFDYDVSGGDMNAGLIQASDDKLYGTTSTGGSHNAGLIFSYDLATSKYDSLHNFEGGATGDGPEGALLQAGNAKLYGNTQSGGNAYRGIVFEYDISTKKFFKRFEYQDTTGSQPSRVNLIQYIPYGTGLEKHKNQIATLYPNPSNGEINFEFINPSKKTICIYDSQGALLKTIEHSGLSPLTCQLNTSSGFYFAVIKLQDESVQTFKIIRN